MSPIRAVTLWEPWASLVALGVKTIETRSWPAPKATIGERLLIHAAKRSFGIGSPTAEVVRSFPLETYRRLGHGLKPTHHVDPEMGDNYPLGCVVASATLAACVPMVSWAPLGGPAAWAAHMIPMRGTDAERMLLLRDAAGAREALASDGPLPAEIDATDQIPYGGFAPGRWAWLLEDVKPTTARCPACWGTGWVCDEHETGACAECVWHDGSTHGCPVCTPAGGRGGTGSIGPIPAKGRQGMWTWAGTR